MEVFKIAVKIFAAGDGFAPSAFVPVFHRWIQGGLVEGHRLIDVADYAHVAAGPGTVLVSSEANFYMDRGENRLGLLYARKLPLPGSFQERLRGCVGEAIKAAARLEQEPSLEGKLKFKTDEILIRLNDRLLAPSNEQTIAAAKGDVQAVAKMLYGGKPVTVEAKASPLTLVEFRVMAGENVPLATLVAR